MEPVKPKYADPSGGKQPQRARGLPLIIIGYWRYEREHEGAPSAYVEATQELPSVTAFVDVHWDDAERELVARYLEQGLIAWTWRGFSRCRLCGVANGTSDFTDGVYLWPEGLAHYVREHDVRLPVSVIRHIVSTRANAQPPPSEDEDWCIILRTISERDYLITENQISRSPEWWAARINEDWWNTATLDS